MVELRVAVQMVPLGTWCGKSVEVGGVGGRRLRGGEKTRERMERREREVSCGWRGGGGERMKRKKGLELEMSEEEERQTIGRKKEILLTERREKEEGAVKGEEKKREKSMNRNEGQTTYDRNIKQEK